MSVMTNSEVVEYLGLPQTIINDLATAQGSAFQAVSNQFLSELVNKIVYQKVDNFGWENPFKQFDDFPVNYGDTIENIFVETPKGYEFNNETTDPFGKAKPKVEVLYATINYEMQYKVTIEDKLLRRAALNEYGFVNIINSILQSLTTAKNVDEYYATISCLNNAELYGNSTGEVGSKQFETLNLTGTDTEKSKALTKKIVDIATSFELPSTSNNALGILNASNKSDILLIIKRDLYNSINLDYLAGVYNLNKVDLVKKIMIVEDFRVKGSTGTVNGKDIGFIVLDTKAFDNHVALQDGGMIYNPQGKYTNHFLNLWKIISFKKFYNANAVVVTEA